MDIISILGLVMTFGWLLWFVLSYRRVRRQAHLMPVDEAETRIRRWSMMAGALLMVVCLPAYVDGVLGVARQAEPGSTVGFAVGFGAFIIIGGLWTGRYLSYFVRRRNRASRNGHP